MPGCDTAILKEVLERLLELEETQSVGHCGAVFAGAIGNVFLRKLEFGHQALKGARLLNWVEVFALDVLNQRNLERLRFGNVADDSRNPRQGSALGGAPAALPRNELVASLVASHDQRLDDAIRAYRARQLLKRLFAKARARLIWAGIN